MNAELVKKVSDEEVTEVVFQLRAYKATELIKLQGPMVSMAFFIKGFGGLLRKRYVQLL